MKNPLVLSVSLFTAGLLSSCASSGPRQTASVDLRGAKAGRDVNVAVIQNREERVNSPGNTIVAAAVGREVPAGPRRETRRVTSGSSGGSSYHGNTSRRSGSTVTSYTGGRAWSGEGGHINIPPGATPVGGGVVRHWHGWNVYEDGSRDGEVIDEWVAPGGEWYYNRGNGN